MSLLRRDAARNRERILEAARELRDAGESLQLNAVARRAEVGVGTVYRHFATPDALDEGLAEKPFTALIDVAAQALADDDSLRALRQFLAAALQQYADDPSLAAASTTVTPVLEETRALRSQLIDALSVLIGRVAGRLQSGLDAQDIMLLICGLGYSTRLRPAKATAYLDALLDGVLRQ